MRNTHLAVICSESRSVFTIHIVTTKQQQQKSYFICLLEICSNPQKTPPPPKKNASITEYEQVVPSSCVEQLHKFLFRKLILVLT